LALHHEWDEEVTVAMLVEEHRHLIAVVARPRARSRIASSLMQVKLATASPDYSPGAATDNKAFPRDSRLSAAAVSYRDRLCSAPRYGLDGELATRLTVSTR
jgi:hypothetical protein